MVSINEIENNGVKVRCINNGKANMIMRVSLAFRKKLDYVNRKRGAFNLNDLSNPKMTELIIRHKLWKKIEEDIINFLLDEEPEEEEEE